TKEQLLLSEKLLNESQKMAKIGSWEVSLETHELIWSEELYNIFEIDPAIKDNLYDLHINSIDSEYIDSFNKQIEHAIKQKQHYEVEYKITCNDGSKKW